VDSLFVKRSDATKADYEELARVIQQETRLPVTLDHHYRFIVFLKQETHPDVEAMNRFFGKLTNGSFNCRGIELRRKDCPSFLQEFQRKLIALVFDADNSREVIEKQMVEAKAFTQATYQSVLRRGGAGSDLAFHKRVHKEVKAYKSMFPHVVAAKQLALQGNHFEDHSSVDFVFTNAEHHNPWRHVLPLALVKEGGTSYDRRKYGKLVLDVAETILNH